MGYCKWLDCYELEGMMELNGINGFIDARWM